jgi:hypothetical protein
MRLWRCSGVSTAYARSYRRRILTVPQPHSSSFAPMIDSSRPRHPASPLVSRLRRRAPASTATPSDPIPICRANDHLSSLGPASPQPRPRIDLPQRGCTRRLVACSTAPLLPCCLAPLLPCAPSPLLSCSPALLLNAELQSCKVAPISSLPPDTASIPPLNTPFAPNRRPIHPQPTTNPYPTHDQPAHSHSHSPCTSKCSQPRLCVIPIPLHSFSSRMRRRPVSSGEKYLRVRASHQHHPSPEPPRRVRFWDQLEHLLGEDDVSVFKLVVGVCRCRGVSGVRGTRYTSTSPYASGRCSDTAAAV